MANSRSSDYFSSCSRDEDECSSIPIENMLLKVITLNCWGLKFISSHREERIKSIAQHLREQDYDLVFLQELWCQSDFDHIRTTTSFKFAHYFKACSIAGTSGLAIFSRWTPDSIHFEPFLVNGSPFRPHHGDWYAGKGVAYARIVLDQVRLHLFCTHLHAQYNEKEQIGDQYSIHRICQAYQMGKFINLATETAINAKDKKDLVILAGDLNTAANEIPFKLLMAMTELNDSCMHRYSHQIRRSFHGSVDTEIEEDLITCGHRSNCYTLSSQKNTSNTPSLKDMMNKPVGKRIDFILYKLLQDSSQAVPYDEHHHMCLVDRVQCEGKDPVTGLSFSDHQPVIVKLVIKKKTLLLSMGDTVRVVSEAVSDAVKMNGSSMQATKIVQNAVDNSDDSVEEIPLDAAEQIELASKQKPRKNSNVFLDLLPGGLANSPRKVVYKEKTTVTSETKSSDIDDLKLEPKVLLQESHQLLRTYLEDNYMAKQRILIMILLLVTLMVSTAVTIHYVFATSIISLFQSWAACVTAGCFLALLVELTNRLEHTAIKSLAEDISCTLEFNK